jgi:hypothetical protein
MSLNLIIFILFDKITYKIMMSIKKNLFKDVF